MLRKTVLVADDDTRLLKALTLRLEHQNFDIIMSEDSYQALQLARRTLPDVMVLDINMPGGDAFSVLERLAKIEELASTPVILITGQSAGLVDAEARRYGAFGVLHKPFETSKLAEMIWAASDSGHRIPDSPSSV